MKKRIFAYALIGLFLVLSVTSLVLALVKVNKNDVISRPDVVYISNSTTKGNKSGYCKALSNLFRTKAQLPLASAKQEGLYSVQENRACREKEFCDIFLYYNPQPPLLATD